MTRFSPRFRTVQCAVAGSTVTSAPPSALLNEIAAVPVILPARSTAMSTIELVQSNAPTIVTFFEIGSSR